MCGIGGFILKEPVPLKSVLPKALNMLRALHHRGPDGHGAVFFGNQRYFTLDSITHEHMNIKIEACLCHTRLSIIDLSEKASQPMQSHNGRYWITYNGELYNFRQIRDDLIRLGESFSSESDTEVVLKAYIHWGEECLHRFKGMFAFAIYDTVTKEAFFCRDRIGMKPFYYHDSGQCYCFASDVTTLIASGWYTPQPNWEGIYHGFIFQNAPRPLTVYKDVFALEPAHFLKYGEKPSKYWSLPFGEENRISESSALEQLETLIHHSVQSHLVADVDVAALLSGGVDSTTLTAIASQYKKEIKAFSLAYDGTQNEIEQAQATSQKYPIKHVIENISEQEVIDSLDEMCWVAEEPIGNIEPHFHIAKAIHQHQIKVVLHGLGPDELLGGYKYYYLTYYLWPLARLFRFLSPWMPTKLATLMQCRNSYDIFTHFLPHIIHDSTYEQSSAKWLNRFLTGKPSDRLQALSYADLAVFIGSHHNHTTDRFLMHFGIEGRFPYLDHELVEFCFRLPPSLKIRFSEQKYLLRKIAAKYVHPSTLEMNKMGFGIYEHHYLSDTIIAELNHRIDSLRKREIIKNDLIEQKPIHTLQDARRLIYFSNFERWYETFIERKHPLFRHMPSIENYLHAYQFAGAY